MGGYTVKQLRLKTIFQILYCCSLLLLIVACSNTEKQNSNDNMNRNDTNVKLEFWTPFSGGDNRFMTELVNTFNKENDHIEIVQVNSRLDDYYSRLKIAIMAGNAPDIAILHQTSLSQFVQNGYIEDISIPAQKVGLDWQSINSNIVESTIYDGTPYAVPLDTHTLVFYYNKDYLAAANLLDEQGEPLINDEQSMEQFFQKLDKALPKGVAPLAQPSTRIDSVWLWWSLYNQLDGGGLFYNKKLTKSLINNPQALQALEYVNELYTTGIIPPNINDAFKLFYDGQAAVLITGVWGTGAFEEVENLNFGVIPLPTVYDHAAVWGDSHTLVIPTKQEMTDKKREAALYFMKWMVEHGAMWAKAGHVPSMTAVLETEEFQELDYRSDYAATGDYVAYWPRHVRQWSMVEILIQEFEKMNFGQQTPAETLAAIEKQINAQLED